MKKTIWICTLLLICLATLLGCETEAPHIHEYGAWQQITAPGCVSKGEEKRECACGESETRSIDATGVHSFGEWQTVTPASCNVQGSQKRTCVCGESETQPLAPLGECQYGTDNACVVCHVKMTYTEGLSYSASPDGVTYTVTGRGSNETLSDLIIPLYHEGKPVVSISSFAFYEAHDLLSVAIPGTVTRVEECAFANCISLRSVTFAQKSTLEVLEGYAFSGCSSLADLKIPESVRSIKEHAFNACTALRVLDKDVVYVDTWAVDWEYSGREGLSLRSNTVGIADHAFEAIGIVPYLVFPDGMKYIGDYAFYNCLCETITIPGTVVSIGKGAFGICEVLREASFQSPTGWYVCSGADDQKIILNLNFPKANVALLARTYTEYYWYKE